MHSREYYEYVELHSPQWEKKRCERYAIDDGHCCMCGQPVLFANCHTHHNHYRNLGHEDVLLDLATLCPTCHKNLHRFYRRRGGIDFAKTYMGQEIDRDDRMGETDDDRT